MWPRRPPGSSGEGEQLSPWILSVSAAPTLARPGLRGGAEGRGQRQGEGGEEAARALPAKAGAGIHGAPGPHGHSRRALQAGPPDPPPRLSGLALISVGIVSKAKKTVSVPLCLRQGKTASCAAPGTREGPRPPPDPVSSAPRGPVPRARVPPVFPSGKVQLRSCRPPGGATFLRILSLPFLRAGCKNFPVRPSIRRSLCVSQCAPGCGGCV